MGNVALVFRKHSLVISIIHNINLSLEWCISKSRTESINHKDDPSKEDKDGDMIRSGQAFIFNLSKIQVTPAHGSVSLGIAIAFPLRIPIHLGENILRYYGY